MIDVTKKLKVYPRQTGIYAKPYPSEGEEARRKVSRDVRGYKAPETAYTRQYIDKKCPFAGDVNVTGKIFKGVVKKMKAERTIVVVVNYLHYNKKYKRYSRRHTNFSVHMSPCFDGMINVGDIVVCGGTRPLSKTKSSVILGCDKQARPTSFKQMALMKILNDWEENEIIHKDNITYFDFLIDKDHINEICDGFYYLSSDIRTVEMELWRKINGELADELGIQDTDKEIKGFIALLNKYNEIKDVAQELIGRIADLRQTTSKDIYDELGMDLES